jgi:hypothetical protein
VKKQWNSPRASGEFPEGESKNRLFIKKNWTKQEMGRVGESLDFGGGASTGACLQG